MSRAASRDATGLPGPFRRLSRQPLRLAAIILLAATALAASGIQSAAALALRATLDENWRGHYDILVTAADGLQPIDGLLPPNTLADAGALSIDDLGAVRRVDGVEVAAPIGEILVPALKYANAQVMIPRGHVEGADVAPQAFRFTMTYTTDDGLGERLVARDEIELVIDETPKPVSDDELRECLESSQMSHGGRFGEYAVTGDYPALKLASCRPGWMTDEGAWYPDSQGGWSGSMANSGEDYILLSLPAAPQAIARITLIDPVAERTLLGHAGAFFDPLVGTEASEATDIEAMRSWAARDEGEFARQFDGLLAFRAGFGDWYPPEAMAELRQLFRDNGDDFDEMIAEGASAERVIPLLISQGAVAQLSLKVDVEAFGDVGERLHPYMHAWETPTALADGEPGTIVGSSAGDVSELLNPFAASTRPLVWPGADLALADQAIIPSVGSVLAVGELAAQGYSKDRDGFRLSPTGFSMPVDENQLPENGLRLAPSGEHIGAESAYLRATRAWASATGAPILAVPVGAFDGQTLGIDEDAANYVPLGAYAPVSSTLTSGEHAGTTMRPSLAGLGLVSPRTVAIGSIHSAGLWRDETPISAIRVRVADIDAYTPDAQQRVIEVAQSIEALGLSASIVAGSSPTDQTVLVDGYAFGTMDPDATQHVGELGTVTQRWSELGAAARVSLSVSTATLAILGIALAAGILLLGAVQLAGIPARREQAVVMREIGFTRPRIARWFAAEEVPGLVVVAVVGAVAWWVSGGTGVSVTAASLAVAAVVVTGAASVIAGSRVRGVRMPRDARSRRLGARSVAGFGARQVLVHPLTSAVHVLAIVIVGLAAAGLVAALLAGRDAAGQSSLALLTLGQQLGPQIALGAAGVVGGILLARLTRRLDLARRAEQWATLRAAGWTSGQLATAQRVEGFAVVVPGLLVTAGLAWAGAVWLELAPVELYVAVAAAAGLLTALVAFSTRRKGTA